MDNLVSVVIPVYNVEKYLDRCVSSVVNQTYGNLEVILVDDGSSDHCPEMCDAWKKKDRRIRVIHKKNAGLGMARNTGVDNASGEYICFFDADDYVHPDTVKICYENVTTAKADIVHFGMQRITCAGKVSSALIPGKKDIYRDDEIRERLLPYMFSLHSKTGFSEGIPLSLCSCFISRQLIERIQWRCVSEREIISEDIYALLQLYSQVRCAVALDRALYCYCDNPASLSRTVKLDRLEKNRFFYLSCLQLCDSFQYGDKVRHCIANPFLGNMIGAAKQIVVCDKPFYEKQQLLKTIINDELIQNVLKATKHDQRTVNQRILFFSWRNHFALLSYVLLRLKAK